MNSNFSKILKDMILEYGKNILKNDKSIKGYIEDLLINFPAEKNISIYLVESNILKELSKKEELDKKDIEKYIEKIINNYGADAKITKKVIIDWINALDISVDNKKQNDNKIIHSYTTQFKKSFLSKLISGDFGAKKTFWLFGVPINFFIIELIIYSEEISSRIPIYNLSGFTSWLLYESILSAILAIWNLIILISLWNANYYKHKTTNFWSVVAYIILTIVILSSILVVWQNMHRAIEYMKIDKQYIDSIKKEKEILRKIKTNRISTLDSDKWFLPNKEFCEANGGYFNNNECKGNLPIAKKICKIAGGRLPIKREYEIIYNVCKTKKEYQKCYREYGFTNKIYWTISPLPNDYFRDSFYAVDFNSNKDFFIPVEFTDNFYIYCIKENN